MSFLKEQFGSWYRPLLPILKSEGFNKLGEQINNLYKTTEVFPERENLFRAFKLCPYKDLKIIVLGQDPYYDIIKTNPITPRSTGLAFSNNSDTIRPSPSLENIQIELENDLDVMSLNFDYTLENWAKQGVLLLNTALTVERGQPKSHSKIWNRFTIELIKHISSLKTFEGIIWILLGKKAQEYKKYMCDDLGLQYHTIEAAHPASECYKSNAGFFGSKIFTRANNLLELMEKTKIKWN